MFPAARLACRTREHILEKFGPGRSSDAVSRVALLLFLAPAFDFDVVENLPDDATKQSLEVRALQVAQATDGFLLVSLEQRPGAMVGSKLGVERLDLRRANARGKLTAPDVRQVPSL